MEQTKKAYLSKTLWVNFLIAGFALFQPEWIPFLEDPNYVMVGMVVINTVLRLVSKDKLELY